MSETVQKTVENEVSALDSTFGFSRDELKEAFDLLQEGWKEMEATIRGNGEVVKETDDYVVIAYGDSAVRHDIEALAEEGEIDGDIDTPMSDLLHALAKDLTDYDWGYSYPVIIEKDNSS